MKEKPANRRDVGSTDLRAPPDTHKIVSAVLAAGWLAAVAMREGRDSILGNLLSIAVPLACIWFPYALGSVTNMMPTPLSTMPITRPSPGSLLRIFGWIAFLALTAGREIVHLAMKP